MSKEPTRKEQFKALAAATDQAERIRLIQELLYKAPAGDTSIPLNAPAFRRREGRTIKMDTAPPTSTFGVFRLIKGGQR
jgi:hypothetical protein